MVEVMHVAQDLRVAWDIAQEGLRTVDQAGWEVAATPTKWSCRDTLDHMANGLCGYATSLSNRLTSRRRLPRNGDAGASPSELIDIVGEFVGLLAVVAESAPPGERGLHPSGMADRDGFVAMGCDELLIHTFDIATAAGTPIAPPSQLVARIRDRLFPWAPSQADPWQALLWANGRAELTGIGRLEADWWWQSAPHNEWTGERRRRTTDR